MSYLKALLLLEVFGFLNLSLAFPSPPVLDNEERLDNIEERGLDFEGDILLSERDLLQIRSGEINPAKRWPNNTVIYEISDDFDENQKDIIRSATQLISDFTCITFCEREYDEEDYVYVVNTGSGCSSYVGRQGGAQKLNLASSCLKKQGTIAHEFIHAVGYHHEQSRTDRDEYVNIVYDNIAESSQNNFRKYSESVVSPFGVPYDYGSIMHYSEYGFAIDPKKKTIEPLQPYEGKIGQREALSENDIQKINNMYECELRKQ